MHYDVCKVTGKRMFATIGEAKAVITKPSVPVYYAGKRVKRRMNKRKETRAYKCDHCDHFHLTSKSHYNSGKKK